MIVEILAVLLTAAIAVVAAWMAIGLLKREPERLANLSSIGLGPDLWARILGVSLLIAVAALIVGWWVRPIGIAAIVVIKIGYAAALVRYRRAEQARQNDVFGVTMAAHSVVALAAIVSLLVA